MKISSRFQVLLAMALIPILAVFAFIYEQQNSFFRIRQYVGIWEDDIAEALLVKQDSQLLEKIRSQLVLVVPAVQKTEVFVPGVAPEKSVSDDDFVSRVSVPLSLNLNPVGEVQVTLSNRNLLLSSLMSPIFGLGLMLVMGLSLLFARREFRLQVARAQLTQRLQLEKEFSDLALQVAHDIRSPLMALTAVIGLPGSVQAEVLPLLQSAGERIHRIAEDLLSRSRKSQDRGDHASRATKAGALEDVGGALPRGERAKGICQVFDLQPMIENLIKEYQVRFPSLEWVFKANISTATAHVPLSLEKIERLLSNLFQNAADASTSPGKIQVEMFSRGARLNFRIQDSGKGMAPQVLEKILQVGGSFGKVNGNGLGLKDVRETLERVQGKFEIQSQEGVGTLVVLEIPIVSPARS